MESLQAGLRGQGERHLPRKAGVGDHTRTFTRATHTWFIISTPIAQVRTGFQTRPQALCTHHPGREVFSSRPRSCIPQVVQGLEQGAHVATILTIHTPDQNTNGSPGLLSILAAAWRDGVRGAKVPLGQSHGLPTRKEAWPGPNSCLEGSQALPGRPGALRIRLHA